MFIAPQSYVCSCCTRKHLFDVTRSTFQLLSLLHFWRSLHAVTLWYKVQNPTPKCFGGWWRGGDLPYHYCSETESQCSFFNGKEKRDIFLFLTNWKQSRWHGEKACWTHLNNSRRLASFMMLGSLEEAQTTGKSNPPHQILMASYHKNKNTAVQHTLISSALGQSK